MRDFLVYLAKILDTLGFIAGNSKIFLDSDSLAKILYNLGFLAKKFKNFFDSFPSSYKILRTCPRIINKILAGNEENSRLFWARKTKTANIGYQVAVKSGSFPAKRF